MRYRIVAVLLACVIVSSCNGQSNVPGGLAIGAISGAGLGAGLGAMFGNPKIGAIVGSVVGSAVGAIVGDQLDQESEARRQAAMAELASNHAPPVVVWKNPRREVSGRMRRKSPVQVVAGRKCMVVQETITIKGVPKQLDEQRCQDVQGQWS